MLAVRTATSRHSRKRFHSSEGWVREGFYWTLFGTAFDSALLPVKATAEEPGKTWAGGCVCVLHIKPFFYSSTSSTPSVRTDSSP